MPDDLTPPISESSELVAESYPPLPGIEPVRTHRIHWLLALPAALAALICPRRMGAHLAASSWTTAYVAHLLSIILFWGTLWAFMWENVQFRSSPDEPFTPSLSWSDHIRRPFAGCAVFAYMALDSWPAVIAAVVGTVLFELSLWIAAVVLIPMYAAGECRAQLYLRCVKLLLWSTACLIPIGYAIPPLVRLAVWVDQWHIAEMMGYTLALLWAVWYVSVLLRLGGRYGGPKKGPGWEPRAVRCESCNYELTMQPLAGRCPECGCSVADSLPQRRRLPGFATATGLFGWVRAYARTAWRSMFARRFAQAICVRQGHRAARRFAFLTCVIIGIVAALATTPYAIMTIEYYTHSYSYSISYDDPPEWAWYAVAWLPPVGLILVSAACISGLACLAWLLFIGLFVTLFGFRDATRRCIVLCYSSAWLVWPTVFGILGVWGTVAAYDAFPTLTLSVSLPVYGWAVERGLIVGTVLMLPAVASFLLWFLHLRWMLRETRYANS